METKNKILEICKDWRISFDSCNVILEHLSPVQDKITKEAKLTWQVIGYYPSIQRALQAIINKIEFVEDVNTIQGYLDKIKYFEDIVSNLNIKI